MCDKDIDIYGFWGKVFLVFVCIYSFINVYVLIIFYKLFMFLGNIEENIDFDLYLS